jgi:peroxiredoxin
MPASINRLYSVFAVLLLICSELAVADPFEALEADAPGVRVAAPDFTLTSLEGATTTLSDYKGKVVLLNFWATWCLPCRKEMPGMQTLFQRYQKQGLAVLAVSADQGNISDVRSFVKDLGLGFPVLSKSSAELRNTYEVVGLPMSYLIGRDGKISARIIGARAWDSPEAFDLIEYLLKQSPS